MKTEGIFTGVVLFITGLAIFMYILIMGPSRYHRNGVVGQIYEFTMDLPVMCCGCFCSIFYGCNYTEGRQKWRQCSDYTFHERNNFMVIFYIVLVWSVEFLYLFYALPQVKAPLWSKCISWMLVIISEIFYGLAVFSDPGIVTSREEQEAQKVAFASRKMSKKQIKNGYQQKGKGGKQKEREKTGNSNCEDIHNYNNNINNNVSILGCEDVRDKEKKNQAIRKFLLSPEDEARQNKKYIVDGILFAVETIDTSKNNKKRKYSPKTSVGIECITCHISRPSRSKHCRLCGYCVRRFDHHCPWINNDVAENTHRWFLFFIFCHAVSCMWASWDLYTIMKTFLIENRAWGWKIIFAGGHLYRLSLIDYLLLLVSYQTFPACLFFFAFMIGIVLWVFWLYQMSFVLKNLTMNDMFKIDDASMFISSLPSLSIVYREAVNARERLEVILGRPSRQLQFLKEPPSSIQPGSREDITYRNNVRNMLRSDLREIFDRGVWNNLMDVMFPYSYKNDGKTKLKQN